jgi:hypothetical protein
MSLFATERIPSPLAVDGAVFNDVATRTLVVRLSETAGGHAQLMWREAHGALVRAQESGWRTGQQTVWGGAFGNRQIVYAAPGEYQVLLFRFAPAQAEYSRLVGKPNLAAIVTIDRELSRFMSVQFLHRQ